MVIEFIEDTHTYIVNGNIASISVTSLLRKHHLAPDYSNVSQEILDSSAKRGTEVHKDLENVLNCVDYVPTTTQGEQFAEYVKTHFDCGVGEQPLAIDYNGIIIAGTADVMGIGRDGSLILADHKNTVSFHREYVSWQVSLLDYFARKLGNEQLNGRYLNWKGAKEFYCFHYNPTTGDMSIKNLTKISDTEIERLLECEANGEIYQRQELVLEDDLKAQIVDAEAFLQSIEKTYKIAKQQAEELRETLCNVMEKQGIKSWETDKMKITYVAPIDRISVDSKKLKMNYPQIYNDCTKVNKIKSSVRITYKDEDEED